MLPDMERDTEKVRQTNSTAHLTVSPTYTHYTERAAKVKEYKKETLAHRSKTKC